MRVPPIAFRILQALILLTVVGIFVLIVYFFVTVEDTGVSDTVQKAEVARMQATARAYFARLSYFEGVCDAVGAGDTIGCSDAETGYAITVVLSDGTVYCADHTDFLGTIARHPGSATRCNQ